MSRPLDVLRVEDVSEFTTLKSSHVLAWRTAVTAHRFGVEIELSELPPLDQHHHLLTIGDHDVKSKQRWVALFAISGMCFLL
jgi:hypothetical protein